MPEKIVDRGAEPGFRGEAVRIRRVPGFIITQLRHRAPSRNPRHGHPRAFFSCLTAGAYRERDAVGETPYSVGDARFHPEGFRHEDEIGPSGARFLCVELDSDGRALPGFARALESPGFWRRSSEASRLAGGLARELRADDPGSDLVLEGLALQLAGTMARLPAERGGLPRWLARVDERLREERSIALRVSDLAAEAGVHPVHLARAYRKHFHRTVGDDLRRRRVETVRRLLASGETLSGAAADAGFSDQSHMSRVFRRVTGMSPGEYRRSIRVRFRPEG